MVVANNEIDSNIKCRQIDGNFDGHGDTRSHWMPPSGECLRRIAPTAAMVDEFK
jgi:hypothetical protein